MKNPIILLQAFACLAVATSAHSQAVVTSTPGALVNGDFALRETSGMPTSWTFTATPWLDPRENAKTPEGVTITSLQEGSKAIVRITYTNNTSGCLAQVVQLPAESKEARFKVSVRGEPDEKGGKGTMPDCGLRFFDASGKFLADPKSKQAAKQLSDKSWHEIEFVREVPSNAAFCSVILGNSPKVNGVFDFRGASLKIR